MSVPVSLKLSHRVHSFGTFGVPERVELITFRASGTELKSIDNEDLADGIVTIGLPDKMHDCSRGLVRKLTGADRRNHYIDGDFSFEVHVVMEERYFRALLQESRDSELRIDFALYDNVASVLQRSTEGFPEKVRIHFDKNGGASISQIRFEAREK